MNRHNAWHKWTCPGDEMDTDRRSGRKSETRRRHRFGRFWMVMLLVVVAASTLRAESGAGVEAWSVSTEDTKLTVGITQENRLCIYDLSHTAGGWNWTAEPSVFDMDGTVTTAGASQPIRWKYEEGGLDTTDGQKVVIRFVCPEPALELTSVWWARPGRGPVHHSMRIANRSDKPVRLTGVPTLDLQVRPEPVLLAFNAKAYPLTLWSFHTEGFRGDEPGVYRNDLKTPFTWRIETSPDGRFIPYAVLDAGERHGVYVGLEWSHCLITVEATDGPVRLRGGEYEGFEFDLAPGAVFDAPPGFVGTYQGDLDDAGNSLRRYLFRYNTPAVVRNDPTYPKVQWNAFWATGDRPQSWNSVERKYYPFIDAIAPLGFEEVMIDVGWWKGGQRPDEPEPDPVDWPSGMARAADYAHSARMRFGLYWNKGEDMATPAGRQQRIRHVKQLFNEYNADIWRSDNTGGPVVGSTYPSVKGFYSLLDQLYRDLPDFQWENCSSGGQIKDFGAMKRCVKIFGGDAYTLLDNRKRFYNASHMYPPAQLMAHLGPYEGTLEGDILYWFRSCSMGAPHWFIDSPNGGNGGKRWTDEEKAAIKDAVATYKTTIRPLVRNADLYHILPRPDGKNWDGIQYHDPATGNGVVYLFKPAAGTTTMTLRLRGLDNKTVYRVTFNDGTNATVEQTGEKLAGGLVVTLEDAPVSELIFIERAES